MSNQQTYDAGSNEDVGKKRKSVKLTKLQKAEDLRNLLATYNGRTVLWGMLEQCNVYRLSFSGESAYNTAFFEGQRSIGLWLLAEIHQVAPNAYLQMQQEHLKRKAGAGS